MENQVGAAGSHGQLGQIYQLLGDFAKAEGNLLQAVQIREALNIPEVYIT